MALTRVVNGLVAPFQQAYRAKSVAVVCQTLGLPLNLVELRHEAAHSEIPNLAALRPVAISCLHWLYERYWLRQQQYFEETERTTSERLLKLAKLGKKMSSDSFGPQTKNFEAIKQQSKAITAELVNNLTYSQVLTCLVPKFAALLLPTNVTPTQLERKVVELPRRLNIMWMEIITKFAKKWECFIPALLVELVESLFRVTAFLPRFNASLPPLNDPMREKIYKFQIAILRCWYEHLVSEFFEMRVSSAKVEEISDTSKKEVDLDGQSGVGVDRVEGADGSESDSATSSSQRKDAETARKEPDHSKGTQKKQKGGKTRFLLSNDLLPFKPILHVCLQHLNKHSIKMIKLTACYMSDGSERDAILPKLSTLFHFRSRALNLTRAQQTLANGGSEERAKELSKRSESVTQESKPQTELSLSDFETMLRAPTPSQGRVTPYIPSSTPKSLNTSIATDQNDNNDGTNTNGSSISRVHSRASSTAPIATPALVAWTLVEGMPPGLCQSPNGSYDYSLPVALDSYRLATFLVPKHANINPFLAPIQPLPASEGNEDEKAPVDEYSVFGGQLSETEEESEQDQVERKEKPERTTDSDEDAPDAKRRCLDPTPEQIAALEAEKKKKEEEATKKAATEKAKVKLMVGIKKVSKK